ncbi:MAG: hypothetical protein KGD73_04230 [Candidatus Lokiarchaeota archaeon]|nr:hypothetical protein [Candidatus Lokiarchaeota archaeon]
MSNTNGIIALIFGIIGCCCAWIIPIPFVPFLFPIVAIVFGAIGIKKDDSSGMAIAGLVLGIIDVVCIALILVVFAALLAAILGGVIPIP